MPLPERPPWAPRRRLAAATALVLLATTASGCSGDDPVGPEQAATSSGPTSTPLPPVTEADFDAVEVLLAERAAALRGGDLEAFLATVDPGNEPLRETQELLFDNLQRLPVDRLYYGMSRNGLPPAEVAGDDPLVHPRVFEHVRLRRVMKRPVGNEVTMTFVKRDDRWLVGAESDFDGEDPQLRPWYGGPIEVATDDRLVVLTDRDADIGAEELLDRTTTALSDVVDLLDQPSDPVLLDATSNGEPYQIDQSSEDSGATAFDVYARSRDGRTYRGRAGPIVKANPEQVDLLVGQEDLLRHELTHVVLDGYTNTIPQWVGEGIAEYVGSYPTLLAGSYLSQPPDGLDERPVELIPPGLWGSDPTLDYLSARAFAEYLVSRGGIARYVEMMDLFKRLAPRRRAYLGQGIVGEVLDRTYGVSEETVARGGFDLLEGLTDRAGR